MSDNYDPKRTRNPFGSGDIKPVIRGVIGNETASELASILVEEVQTCVPIGSTIKETVRVQLEIFLKRTLRKFSYPSYLQLPGTENILKQAELFAGELAA